MEKRQPEIELGVRLPIFQERHGFRGWSLIASIGACVVASITYVIALCLDDACCIRE